jgi:3-hydroxyacyl-CoA dehydrogenase / enoyl-CoA hydratase / 3-hydroxybutyryl-CoA epimerase
MPEVSYLPDTDSMIATLAIDTAGPVNTIGQVFIADLEKATAQANKDKVRGIILTSVKKRSFLDGANLKELATDASLELIRDFARRGQEAFAALARSPFPVVAVLDGQSALGGGLELLLWGCDHVFATKQSRMGLPEVGVGLFPAAGGTRTLAKVVGFKAAVDMITRAKVSPAGAFADSGFLTICPSDELFSRARDWIRSHQGVVNRNYDPDYREPHPLSIEAKQKIISAARARYAICPHRPYLLSAIECFDAGLKMPFEDLARYEVDRFVPLFAHPNTRNKIDFFFLKTSVGPKLADVDASRAVNVDRIAIIGAGLMGRGIAQVVANQGMKTTLMDVDADTAKAAVETIEKALRGMVAKGLLQEDRKEAVMANIGWTADYEELRSTPLVIECVFEDIVLKRRILAQVQAVNPDAIFGSNTSTIPMADIAEGALRPEQVVGMHYFSPVPVMPLLEVVRGPQSSPAAVATAVTVGRSMGKTVILVSDGPGFYTSRTFGTYMNNGFRLAELGISPWDVDRLALETGFPQGPLHIYGTTGGNVAYHAGHFMASRIPDRMTVPETITKLYEAGYVGAGKPSFYLDHRVMSRNESALQYVVTAKGLPVPSDEEARDILLLAMVNEAFWCLSDGVLDDYRTMDLGAVLGIGFPDCWHGPARYVSLRGIKTVRDRLAELAERFEIRSLQPAPEFDRLISRGLDSHLI